MKLRVLGSAAGGGYPQWNCRCAVCGLYWQGDSRVHRRTQSSIVASSNGQDWALFNCSPDIREQIGANPVLHPREGLRHSPIKAVILTNADVDHIGGLISLREQNAFTVWASAKVLDQIDANPIFAALNRDIVVFKTMETGKSFEATPKLRITAFEVPGKVPLYREAEQGFAVSRNGDTLGLHIETDGKRACYVPGCGEIDERLKSDLKGAELLLFDGTLWKDDEMITSGTGTKTGKRMGHVPVSGADGSMAQLQSIDVPRRYFIHMNNTNPLLIDDSPERREAEAAGWLVSDDCQEITL
ncbi:MAG: pyrroloquinoline quinone biosynthesis protein PqqB [Aestuariivirga sp.]